MALGKAALYHALWMVLTCLLMMVELPSVQARQRFLQEIPNGEWLGKAVGHLPMGGRTDFGKKFLLMGARWTQALCQDKFPGSDVTIGQAFGDPCCVWKKGERPTFRVSLSEDFPNTIATLPGYTLCRPVVETTNPQFRTKE
ncbi:TPA: hypothetical protein N0F65_005468 [Lagenidium giganteum]|uniref:Temptin Cys/Cys disulfide domain-containing protein n=1 Tax=Lagenidium giganteum TaxID=4803 RepID=A0AAV2YYS4_9STRA|nr:TPA: hypothetical protein N0F65_005468 [Lagenidium giganteum]